METANLLKAIDWESGEDYTVGVYMQAQKELERILKTIADQKKRIEELELLINGHKLANGQWKEKTEMKELIEKLKKNEKPFGLLSDEEQECLQNVGKENCEGYMVALGDIANSYWNGNIGGMNEFITHIAYRIKSDYNPEPEIVECKVDVNNCGVLTFFYDGIEDALNEAIDRPDWYGLKWSDGKSTVAESGMLSWRRKLNGNLEWPTHVLMREVK